MLLLPSKRARTVLVTAVNKSIDQIQKKNLTEQYLANAGKYMKVNTVNTSMFHYWKYFAKGVEYTVLISIVSTFFGVIIGVVLALMRFSKQKWLRGLAISYTEFTSWNTF